MTATTKRAKAYADLRAAREHREGVRQLLDEAQESVSRAEEAVAVAEEEYEAAIAPWMEDFRAWFAKGCGKGVR